MKNLESVHYLAEFKDKIQHIYRIYKSEKIESLEGFAIKFLSSSPDWAKIPIQFRKFLILNLVFNTIESVSFLHCSIFKKFLIRNLQVILPIETFALDNFLKEIEKLRFTSHKIKEEDFLMYIATSRRLSFKSGALSTDLFPDYLLENTPNPKILESEREIQLLWLKLNKLLESKLKNNVRNWCVLYLMLRTNSVSIEFLKDFKLDDSLLSTLKKIVLNQFGIPSKKPFCPLAIEALKQAELIYENMHDKKGSFYSTDLSSELVLKSLLESEKHSLCATHFHKLSPEWQVFLLEWANRTNDISLESLIEKNRIYSNRVKNRILSSLSGQIGEKRLQNLLMGKSVELGS